MFMSTKLQRKDVSSDLKIVAFAQLRNLHLFKNLANKKYTSASLNAPIRINLDHLQVKLPY